MEEFLTGINLGELGANAALIITGLVGAASGIVAITPSQKDDALLEKAVKFLERFSFIKKKPTK